MKCKDCEEQTQGTYDVRCPDCKKKNTEKTKYKRRHEHRKKMIKK